MSTTTYVFVEKKGKYLYFVIKINYIQSTVHLPAGQKKQSSGFSKPVGAASEYVPFGHKMGSDVFTGQ